MARRRSKLEIEISKLFKDIGTIYFRSYDELSMMLGENDKNKIIKELKKLDSINKIYIDFDNNTWRMDYISF